VVLASRQCCRFFDNSSSDADGDGTPDEQPEYEYHDSGIRVGQTKTVDGNGDGDFTDPEDTSERTDYLVDHHNPTGFAQVLEELVDGVLSKSYTLGLDVIAQALASTGAVHFFLYDGHGSTRALLNLAGEIAVNEMGTPETTDDVPQIFAYDAYGNPIGFDPAAALTTLLYSGEQLDQLTGLQYLRARYYDLSTGRFTRLDPFFGNLNDPQSLQKYLYAHADPGNGWDPTGEEFRLATLLAVCIVAMFAVSKFSGRTDLAFHGIRAQKNVYSRLTVPVVLVRVQNPIGATTTRPSERSLHRALHELRWLKTAHRESLAAARSTLYHVSGTGQWDCEQTHGGRIHDLSAHLPVRHGVQGRRKSDWQTLQVRRLPAEDPRRPGDS
jgi:RHS repeat-associated protein